MADPAISRPLDQLAVHRGNDDHNWWVDILVFIKTAHTQLFWSVA
jgi:hypothetical protein